MVYNIFDRQLCVLFYISDTSFSKKKIVSSREAETGALQNIPKNDNTDAKSLETCIAMHLFLSRKWSFRNLSIYFLGGRIFARLLSVILAVPTTLFSVLRKRIDFWLLRSLLMIYFQDTYLFLWNMNMYVNCPGLCLEVYIGLVHIRKQNLAKDLMQTVVKTYSFVSGFLTFLLNKSEHWMYESLFLLYTTILISLRVPTEWKAYNCWNCCTSQTITSGGISVWFVEGKFIESPLLNKTYIQINS